MTPSPELLVYELITGDLFDRYDPRTPSLFSQALFLQRRLWSDWLDERDSKFMYPDYFVWVEPDLDVPPQHRVKNHVNLRNHRQPAAKR